MKTAKTNDRRNFLLAAGVGTAGAVAAVATMGKAGPAAKQVKSGQPRGYHDSAHIQKYYRTTEV